METGNNRYLEVVMEGRERSKTEGEMVGRCRAVPDRRWSGRLPGSGAGRSGDARTFLGDGAAGKRLLEEESSWTKIGVLVEVTSSPIRDWGLSACREMQSSVKCCRCPRPRRKVAMEVKGNREGDGYADDMAMGKMVLTSSSSAREGRRR